MTAPPPPPTPGLGSTARQGPRDEHAPREYLRAEEGDRVRQMKGTQSINPFDISPELLAKYPDLSFQWNNYEVFGRPDNRQVQYEQMQGWRACPHSMFPGYFAPVGEPGYIIVKDEILMERPKHLTNEARQEEIGRAMQNQMVNQRKAAQPSDGTTAPRFNPNGQFVTSRVVPLEVPGDDDF